ncbi:MAG: oligopeptide/dipeptide ABC transporter ATP-binding protein, partial [Actinomycetota bacterium]
VTRLDKEPEGRLKPIRGAPPSLINVPSGCSFHPRCDYVQPQCQTDSPVLQVRTADAGHLAACHFAGQLPEPKEAAE